MRHNMTKITFTTTTATELIVNCLKDYINGLNDICIESLEEQMDIYDNTHELAFQLLDESYCLDEFLRDLDFYNAIGSYTEIFIENIVYTIIKTESIVRLENIISNDYIDDFDIDDFKAILIDHLYKLVNK